MRKRSWLLWITLAGFVARLGAWIYYAVNIRALVTQRLPDDALYYFTIARNLAQGHGLSFDGIHPTNGMHPLWLFATLPVFLLGLTNWAAIHAVLLFQSVLDTIVVWFIGSTIYDCLEGAQASNRRTAAGSAALLYALSPIAIVRGINGLETTITALLLVLWLRAFLRWRSKTLSGVWLGLVTGLLLLARTDSFIILLPLCIYALWTWRSLPAVLIALAIVAPWLIWNTLTFGSPLQSSAEAVPFFAMKKYDVLYGVAGKFLPLTLDAVKNMLKPFLYSTLCISLLTIVYSIGTLRSNMKETHRSVYFLLAGCLLLLVIHTIFRGFIREWYVQQMVPLFLIGYGISIAVNISERAHSGGGRWWLMAILLVLQGLFFMSTHYASQEAVVDRGVPVVEKLTPKNRIASFNSGYYGYFANRAGSVVDLDGVVNSDVLRAVKQGALYEYLNRDSVDYLLDFQGDFGGYKGLIDPRLLDDFRIDSTIATEETGNPILLYGRKNASR